MLPRVSLYLKVLLVVFLSMFGSNLVVTGVSAATYSNCSAVNKSYPFGIAKTKSSATSAVLSGYAKPAVSSTLYEAIKKFADKPGLGFGCVKFAKPELGTVTVKTDWGYIIANKVKRPQNGICVNVPIVLDIRNANKINQSMGITIQIEDDFENVVGYQEWWGNNESQNASNGKFPTYINVCKSSHKWIHSSGNRYELVQGLSSENWYWLYSYGWLSGGAQGSSDYEFKK